MKKFFNILFVVLGVLFLLQIIVLSYLYFSDAYGIKTLLSGDYDTEITSTTGDGTAVDKHPALSESQEKTLETLGIDPATLPTELTPEQMACFENKFGKARVEEIKNGASPTPSELFLGRDCI